MTDTRSEPLEAPRAEGERPRGATKPAWQRHIRPVHVGILVLALVTAGFTLFWHTQLFSYNTFLLAVIGAVSLSILVGTTGLLSLGNASFMAVGAFGTVFAMNAGVPFPLDIVVGGAAAALAGLVIGLPVARLRGFHMALATLAGFFIVDYLGYQYQTHSDKGGAAGFNFESLYLSRGLDPAQQAWAWTLFVVIALVLLIASRLVHERSGRALRMIRDHEIAAGTLGIRSTRYKLTVFAMTSCAIGVQGGLLAYLLGSASSNSFTLAIAINYLAMVLIGGADSIAGAVIGAGIFTALPVVVPKIVANVMGEDSVTTGPAVAVVVSGLLLVFFIAAAPRGLVGLFQEGSQRLRGRRRTPA